jgi:Tol biopolymer transport system component
MSTRITFEGPGLQIGNTFYTVDADSIAVTPLFVAGENYHFAYSPDGAWLVIARPIGDDLYTSSGTLVTANVVTNEFVNTASEYAWAADPVWQNDSSSFLLTIPPKDPWIENPGSSVVWKVTNTGNAARLNTEKMSFFPSEIASFDPSFAHMAFTTQVGAAAENNWALHVADMDGSGDTQVDSGYFAQLPVWSPDGGKFIYAKTAGSTNQAYLVVGSSAPVLLSDITSLLSVCWLDNTHYVATSRNGSGTSLLLGTVDSSSGVIYNDPGWNDQQGFSFDINE